MLTLKPLGRGNWKPMRMRLDGERGGLLIRVGSLIELGGITWRVCAISLGAEQP